MKMISPKPATPAVLPSEYPRAASIETIKAVIRDEYELPRNAMETTGRKRAIAQPRQIAMYLARRMTQLSLPRIGHHFGGRDHTTVMHACRKVEGWLEDPAFRAHVDDLIRRIGVAPPPEPEPGPRGDPVQHRPDPSFYSCRTDGCGNPRMRGKLHCRNCID